MMNFLVIMIAVYMGTMAAMLTLMVACMSTWFIRKTNKMTEKYMNELFKTDDDKVI